MVFACSLAVSLVAAGFSGGCGPVEPERDRGSSAGRDAAKIDKIEARDLRCPVGDYMPALMGGSLEIAAPQGWDWERPGEKYIVGFVPRGAQLSSLPRILVSAEDNPFPEFERVAEDNVQEFAKRVSEQQVGKDLSEPVRPIVLGGNALVCYATLGKKKNAVVTQLYLETVAGGQHYTIRLEAYQRQFAKYRDAVYAVAMSMKVGSEAESSDSGASTEPNTQPTPPAASQ